MPAYPHPISVSSPEAPPPNEHSSLLSSTKLPPPSTLSLPLPFIVTLLTITTFLLMYSSTFSSSPPPPATNILSTIPVPVPIPFPTPIRTDEAQLHLMTINPSVRCLDSSYPGYYFRPSPSPLASIQKSWIIWFEGGGECVTYEACKARSNTTLGSSNRWPDKRVLTHTLQHASVDVNPNFHDWNMVFLKYCSGDLHMGGDLHGVEDYENTRNIPGVYFSGHLIVDEMLKAITLDHRFNASTNVIWSGESAGGMGSLAHADFAGDYIKESRGKDEKLPLFVAAPVGGFYFSNNWTYAGTKSYPAEPYIPWDYKSLNIYYKTWTAFTPTRCKFSNPDTPWHCMLAAGSYPTLTTPLFVIEAQEDLIVMPLHNGVPKIWDSADGFYPCRNKVDGCPDEILKYMESWKARMWGAVEVVVDNAEGRSVKLRDPMYAKMNVKDDGSVVEGGEYKTPKRDGLFFPACLIHTTFSHLSPIMEGVNYVGALHKWIFVDVGEDGEEVSVYVDDCGLMCNPTCLKTPV